MSMPTRKTSLSRKHLRKPKNKHTGRANRRALLFAVIMRLRAGESLGEGHIRG